jgi:hypothetical protein
VTKASFALRGFFRVCVYVAACMAPLVAAAALAWIRSA